MKQVKDIKEFLTQLQTSICDRLSDQDGKAFEIDQWLRPAGGGGISTVLEEGEVIEKAGVNFSHITGESLPASASAQRPELAGRSYQALGVSVVVHPRNPHVPTSHMNVRFFIAEKDNEEPVWWFGGGYDLTPYYGDEDDCRHWHQTIKNVCDQFGENTYKKYKAWCDDYFYLPHRDEARGIGGIFFDDLNQGSFEECFNFMQSIGTSFMDAYLPILNSKKNKSYTEAQRAFQLYRRGRYVEFNLVHDRGTLFGLQSKGRTESILMSMPPLVSWKYDWQPEANSAEQDLYERFLPRRDWLN